MTAQNKPLVGVKVIDLTQIYQGPYAAFLFAQAGADVIKVEPLAGERLRGAGGAKTPLSFAMLIQLLLGRNKMKSAAPPGLSVPPVISRIDAGARLSASIMRVMEIWP